MKMDFWQYESIKEIPNWKQIFLTDKQAYDTYPQHNWIYDKCELIKRLESYPVYLLPQQVDQVTDFPVFVKPRTNFNGMGARAQVVRNKQQLYALDLTGLIAQKHLYGIHISTDYVIVNGEIADQFAFIGHKTVQGSFWCFASTRQTNPHVENKVKQIGLNQGIINVETIGGKIIEMHLRGSLQFIDICGGMLEQYAKYYNKEISKWTKTRYESTFSYVCRRKTDAIPNLDTKKLPQKPPTIRSVRFCWTPGANKPLSNYDQDEFSYRYLIINGTSVDDIENYIDKLAANKAIAFTENKKASRVVAS